MSNQKSYLNQQDLIDHAKNPKNYGLKKNCDFASGEHNPSCGDSIMLCGSVYQDKIKEVSFEGKGCMLSLAMASKLTEHVQGMTLDQLLQLDEEVVEKLLQVSLGPNRMQCGMLSVIALQKGIRFYQEILK